ncbi:hypothetical protein J3F83DRAFT_89089 [Trichoderma novae-zelandiae]
MNERTNERTNEHSLLFSHLLISYLSRAVGLNPAPVPCPCPCQPCRAPLHSKAAATERFAASASISNQHHFAYSRAPDEYLWRSCLGATLCMQSRAGVGTGTSGRSRIAKSCQIKPHQIQFKSTLAQNLLESHFIITRFSTALHSFDCAGTSNWPRTSSWYRNLQLRARVRTWTLYLTRPQSLAAASHPALPASPKRARPEGLFCSRISWLIFPSSFPSLIRFSPLARLAVFHTPTPPRLCSWHSRRH